MRDEIATAAAKAAPPVTVLGAEKLFDLTLNEWVAVGTLIYLVLQAYVLIRNEIIRKRRK